MSDTMAQIMNATSVPELSAASLDAVSGPEGWRQRLTMITEMMRKR